MAREPFNTRWAQGVETQNNPNSYQAPSNVRLDTGWEGGQDKDAPPAGQENWWHNRVDSALQDAERYGIMSWHAEAIYGLGSPSLGSDGNYYESLAASNTGNDPVSTNGFWRFTGSTFFNGHESGDVKAVAHNGVPSTGWLKCNGAVLLRSSYPRLFSKIGITFNIGGENSLQFRLPDFRGEFLRGFDDGRGINPGRAFGSLELGAVEDHNHYLPTTTGAPGATWGIQDTSFEQTFVNPYPLGSDTSTTYPNPLYGQGELRGSLGNYAAETRPRNRAVNYWIKY